MDMSTHNSWGNPKLNHSKSYSGSVPSGYGNYAVPRGLNGAPPTSKAIPPAVPPRNRNMSEGEGHSGLGSQGSSPNDKGGLFPSRLRAVSQGITKSPSVGSITEELSLDEFMGKYSKSLPHRVKVCKGFYGVSDQTAVTTGDILNMHFLKSTKVVVIETGPHQGSTSYSVPLTSAIQFSPLYDPNDNLEEAKRGFWFNTVGDLLALKSPLPKIVRVTKSHHGTNADNSVAENELLLIKSARSKLTGKSLRVHSLTANRKKCLSESCAGQFTTSPDKLCMYLYEMSSNLSDTFPCKALVSFFDSTESVLNDLQGCIVHLKKSITETSVIATNYLGDDGGEIADVAEMPVNLDIEVEAIPLDEHDIEQLRTDTREMYDEFDPFSVCLYLTKATKRMYDIQSMLYTKLMNGNDFRGLEIIRPNAIINQPRRGGGGHAPLPPVPIPPPTAPSSSSSASSSASTGSSATSSGSSATSSGSSATSSGSSTMANSSNTTQSSSLPPSGYQSLNSTPSRSGSTTEYYVVMSPGPSNRTISQDDISDQSGDSVISQREHLALLENHNRHLEGVVSKNSEEVKRLTTLVEHLSRRVESLANQLRMSFKGTGQGSEVSSASGSPGERSVDNRPPAPLPVGVECRRKVSGGPVSGDDGTYHLIGGTMEGLTPPDQARGIYSSAQDDESAMNNEDYLATLNHQQVLNLLDVMGLKVYTENFSSEQVNGEILSECDDEVLKVDLGIGSKLHRMRLLKVISGKHSARNILNGEDPYEKRKTK